MLQNELAVARSKHHALSRLLWVPASTVSGQPQQQAFIDALHQDAQAQYGADLITGDLESLKSAIHATLNKLQQPPEPKIPEAAAAVTGKLIYLIFDKPDRPATIPLRKFLRAQGFEVVIPAFEGDAAEVRRVHQQSLTDCDAVVLYCGAGDEAWKANSPVHA